jgi:creatinine deaminase
MSCFFDTPHLQFALLFLSSDSPDTGDGFLLTSTRFTVRRNPRTGASGLPRVAVTAQEAADQSCIDRQVRAPSGCNSNQQIFAYHPGMHRPEYAAMLDIALQEARLGLAEGGIPIGAALFDTRGTLLGRGRNRRIQEGDPSIHAETDAFRKAGRRRSYQDTVMATTLAPCWYCCGLVVQFRIGRVVVGESRTFRGGIDWLRERGVEVIDLDSKDCESLLSGYIQHHPEVWNEDIGED